MKIAVVCANGKEGRLIVKEALERGLDVTAFVRGENRSDTEKAVVKDLFDLSAADFLGYDIVIDAFGAWTPETLPQHSASLKHLCNLMSGKDTRLLVVGGAGSLYLDPEHKVQLMEGADFPDAFKPLADAMGKALDELRTRNDVKWTYLSPAADFRADGEKTGEYIISGEEFTTNANGESVISYADFASAMIDEAINGAHIHERISVIAK